MIFNLYNYGWVSLLHLIILYFIDSKKIWLQFSYAHRANKKFVSVLSGLLVSPYKDIYILLVVCFINICCHDVYCMEHDKGFFMASKDVFYPPKETYTYTPESYDTYETYTIGDEIFYIKHEPIPRYGHKSFIYGEPYGQPVDTTVDYGRGVITYEPGALDVDDYINPTSCSSGRPELPSAPIDGVNYRLIEIFPLEGGKPIYGSYHVITAEPRGIYWQANTSDDVPSTTIVSNDTFSTDTCRHKLLCFGLCSLVIMSCVIFLVSPQ